MKMKAHQEALQVLDELEEVLEPGEHQAIRTRHVRSAGFQDVDHPPLLILPPWDQRDVELFPVADAVRDPSMMLYNELCRGFSCVRDWMRVRDDRPLQVRPDFGSGLVASAFGGRVEVVDNNPPWVHPPVEGDASDHLQRFLESFDAGDVMSKGWLPRAAETLDYYTTVFRDYPRVSASVAITLPDLQGPFDTAAMLWGSEILVALITEPDQVDCLLGAIVAVMISAHSSLRQWVGRELLSPGFSHQHGSVIRGNLMIRCDSNLMMSPEMYRSQVFEHDRRALAEVGGGSYHSCGRWQQNIPTVMSAEEVGSLDFGLNQSHLNDIDEIYVAARQQQKHLNLVAVTPSEVRSGAAFERFPLGATLHCIAASVDEAADLMACAGSNS
jgi:hypothetical protein